MRQDRFQCPFSWLPRVLNDISTHVQTDHSEIRTHPTTWTGFGDPDMVACLSKTFIHPLTGNG
ncbi:hypothetical protein PAXRUDRAFT_832813 [Paxillus rubicundulus Ve08.2h10]|uniref:Uncharacterized protein n=1 Tax=Paxillus rubicundulus Ve08.2h10 TaxID=930991 RepID=A0A0D0CFM7_9AGAM|nr:hypothetical protein PAXRUDRAFT_832813 [Paxillus rubicundulus Ve08.2h10]